MNESFSEVNQFHELCYSKGFTSVADACTGRQSGGKSRGQYCFEFEGNEFVVEIATAMQVVRDSESEEAAFNALKQSV